jgi:hypothetical protein
MGSGTRDQVTRCVCMYMCMYVCVSHTKLPCICNTRTHTHLLPQLQPQSQMGWKGVPWFPVSSMEEQLKKGQAINSHHEKGANYQFQERKKEQITIPITEDYPHKKAHSITA